MAKLAALLLAALVAARNATAESTPAQTASSDTHALCVALIAWNFDHPPEGGDFGDSRHSRVDLELAHEIPTAEAKSMLVPNYFAEMPDLDPWGNAYQILRNSDSNGPWTWAARSLGEDGRFCADSYLVPQPDWDKCDDVVRVDGVLVAGPEYPRGK